MFIDWRQASVYGVIVAILLGSIWLFRKVRSTTPRLRIPIRIFSALVAGVSLVVLLLLIGAGFMSKSTYSELLYSPDRRFALRVESESSGALGGDTDIVLTSHHGLASHLIYVGEFGSVRLDDVRWVNDRDVLISYPLSPQDRPPYKCGGTFGDIQVLCIPNKKSSGGL
jgi:hypothetical protein